MPIHNAHQATNHLASRFLGHYCQLLENLPQAKPIDLAHELRQLGVSLNPTSTVASHITLNQYYQLLSQTAPKLQASGFFLQLGQCFDISDAGVLGYASLSVDNLRQSWELTSHSYALYPHPLIAQRIISRQTVSLRLNTNTRATQNDSYLQEEWLSATWKWMCQRLPEIANNSEVTVKLTFPEPSYAKQYSAIFPGKIFFNQAHSELCFPESWYDISFATANPATAELCQQQCLLIMSQLGKQTDFIEQVQRFLLMTPQREFPNLKEIASHFNMASHSFHRQLKKSGMSYRDIVNEVKMELAKDYLANTNLPLQEVSYLLGYKHPENFYRAFKNNLGLTATSYRKTAS